MYKDSVRYAIQRRTNKAQLGLVKELARQSVLFAKELFVVHNEEALL